MRWRCWTSRGIARVEPPRSRAVIMARTLTAATPITMYWRASWRDHALVPGYFVRLAEFANLRAERWLRRARTPSSDSGAGSSSGLRARASVTSAASSVPGDPVQVRTAGSAAVRQAGWPLIKVAGGTAL